MSKYNMSGTKTRTTNLAGGTAFKQTDKMEFVSILLTSFVKDQYYRSEDETVDRIVELVNGFKDKKFAAKAAIYARTKFGMRSVSHVVAREIARVQGQEWTKKFFEKVIYRPDDMLEIMARYLSTNDKGRILPNSFRKGFAKALENLNEYTLAKYRGEGKDVSMVDLVNLVHPKATKAITKLMKGDLKSEGTWETKLSKGAQKVDEETGETVGRKDEEEVAEVKKGAWAELIKSGTLGQMALLKNLRNIMQQAPDSVDAACALLTNEERIRKSLILPFRYVTAVEEVEKLSDDGARKVLKALNKAVDIACKNVPEFPGKTLVVLDTSGSMEGQPAKIGGLFSAILYKSNDADFMNFSDDAEYHTLNASDSVITIARSMHFKSGGTNFHAIFEKAKKAYDRIVILSDMQGWMEGGFGQEGGSPTSTFAEYKKKFKADPIVYSFDLQGYGTLQFPERNVYCLAGFSEKVFSTMKMLETDKNALVAEIEKIEL